ncbi:hypothetical protein HELRODRAFT_66382, partial [Helobdella robusta]|uniref:BHLH domain-containing protein n=1 Tax=Helobdella robusta TaxID=6412 RepID=T1FYK5_HELRO
TNPSKRHRERLNFELERLANLLPFEKSVISKLDKLSILRLAVSYLRSKNYFQSIFCESSPHYNHGNYNYNDHHSVHSGHQALNGFLMMVTDDGEIFYVSETVEQYLGFHQSDIIHQSVLDLIHSEDRAEFRKHLKPSPSSSSLLPSSSFMPSSSSSSTSGLCYMRKLI